MGVRHCPANEIKLLIQSVHQKKIEKINMSNHQVINEKSKRIVERKGLARVPIYERLQPNSHRKFVDKNDTGNFKKSYINRKQKSLRKPILPQGKINKKRYSKKESSEEGSFNESFRPKINDNSRIMVRYLLYCL